ncbi:MAG TPA: hypothetical protein PLS34_08680 [Gammaproteobacteria bacterium]|nr:hypothetical protein [Gammaproteobacteria bacterium]
MHQRLLFTTALVSALAAAPVLAQSSAATLRIDSGSAMVSTGGEFTTAGSGAQVPGGSRLMLTEGSSATLVYPNGCTKRFESAGVHNVTGTCSLAASGGSGAGGAGVDWTGAGLIAGGTVLVGAVLANQDDVEIQAPVPPVSR